jgi:RimJ/RimL family protein N-acetyltransferase
MTAIPRIETERLLLRGQRLGDFDAFAALWASDRARYIGGPVDRQRAWTTFAADLGQWALRGFGMWSVEARAGGALCGWVGLYQPDHYRDPELGWTLLAEAEGRGIAAEAARAARGFARDLGIRRLVSFIDARNVPSIRLAERLGAAREFTGEGPRGPFHAYVHPEARP